jgi:hypothetical protein
MPWNKRYHSEGIANKGRCFIFLFALLRNYFFLYFSILTILTTAAGAVETTWEYSVQVTASIQTSPAQITLAWLQDSTAVPTNYIVSRKALDDTSWGPETILPGSLTNYVDNDVVYGQAYEYRIVKNAQGYKGFGYIYAGIEAPLIENRGKLILVVDNTYASDLQPELARLQQDIVGDGWTVIRQDVTRTDSVANVKALIQARYDADPQNVNAVFLFGHVPVPYSGDIVPDGHPPNHQGAWPADVYYGDMDGAWTDSQVNSTVADSARNWNVPGDGKFDQSNMPSTVRLMVGRVDLANMPGKPTYNSSPTFPSELELLRNYLNKDHNFRHKLVDVPRRGLVGDYFGIFDGEAFAASGWRNFIPFFGSENVVNLPDVGTWIPHLQNNAYLWAYGCGGGDYNSISGIGNQGQYYAGTTTDIVGTDSKAVFTMLFGSWLGDWDSEDNLMRAVLATPSYGLTCAWSGRPHWFFHHMALGEPIGYSTRLTQNNGFTGLYENQTNKHAAKIHIALMGDPSLRMHPVGPAANLSVNSDQTGVHLSWEASSDSVAGYNVYRATDANGPYERANDSLVTDTSFTDYNAPAGTYVYMVRAIKLENTPSGSYFNGSEGVFTTADSVSNGTPIVTVSATMPYASHSGLNSGAFTFTRTGSLDSDLLVVYNITGTAQFSEDYYFPGYRRGGIIIIPAGEATAVLEVQPLALDYPVVDKTVVISLEPDPGYTVGTASEDAVQIFGNDVQNVSMQLSNDGVTLTWPSLPERNYHVAYKNTLDDSVWTDMGEDLWSGGGATTTWFDSMPMEQQRFYSVFEYN